MVQHGNRTLGFSVRGDVKLSLGSPMWGHLEDELAQGGGVCGFAKAEQSEK